MCDISLTFADLQRIVMYANAEGRKGKYIYRLMVMPPLTATQGINSTFAWDSRGLHSGGDSEPIPSVSKLW